MDFKIIQKKKKYMARKKLSEEDKKKEFSISIDSDIFDLLDKYLENNNINSRSKYIEHIIRNDMEKRGNDVNKF